VEGVDPTSAFERACVSSGTATGPEDRSARLSERCPSYLDVPVSSLCYEGIYLSEIFWFPRNAQKAGLRDLERYNYGSSD